MASSSRRTRSATRPSRRADRARFTTNSLASSTQPLPSRCRRIQLTAAVRDGRLQFRSMHGQRLIGRPPVRCAERLRRERCRRATARHADAAFRGGRRRPQQRSRRTRRADRSIYLRSQWRESPRTRARWIFVRPACGGRVRLQAGLRRRDVAPRRPGPAVARLHDRPGAGVERSERRDHAAAAALVHVRARSVEPLHEQRHGDTRYASTTAARTCTPRPAWPRS
jgi:hypothetical protein